MFLLLVAAGRSGRSFSDLEVWKALTPRPGGGILAAEVAERPMLHLSHTTGYAILALGCLEEVGGGSFVRAREVAACTGVPEPYLGKILHSLKDSGLVRTKRGYRGGFALGRPAREITLLDIVRAVEGEDRRRCLLGLDDCGDERACPVHDFWREERERIRRALEGTNLADLAGFERGRGARLGTCSGDGPGEGGGE